VTDTDDQLRAQTTPRPIGDGLERPIQYDLPRLVSRGRRWRPIRRGVSNAHPRDLYHMFLRLPTVPFIAIIAASYIALNTVFALIYMTDPGGVSSLPAGSFWDAFFFSVQTSTTVGYGGMAPVSFFSNIVMVCEMLMAMLSLALITGMIFSRFARPTARVMFSHYAVIAPYEGVPTLMFRCANERANQILEAEVRLTLVRNEISSDGLQMRRLRDLELVRRQTSIFSLSWTIMHRIDETSPLFGMTDETLRHTSSELVVILDGIDETYSQPIYARHSFVADEIRWQHRFVDILARDSKNRIVVDYRRFHDTYPIDVIPLDGPA
jgi:inward rectifier potassium channel